MVRTVLAGLVLACLAGCDEPVMVVPGGELSGSVATPPDTWESVPDTIQLEARPDKPYSVNLWALALDGNLYVATNARGTTWSSFIDENARVRVRIDDNIYELNAVEVYDLTERQRVGNGYVSKYDVDAEDNWVSSGLVLRLEKP